MSYTHLTYHERYVIHHLRLYRLSTREIARRLGRGHSTILRELRRNGPGRPEWVYCHDHAHARAMSRRRQPRHRRRQADGLLVGYVVEKLHAHWSPETIAGRLAIEFPCSKCSPDEALWNPGRDPDSTPELGWIPPSASERVPALPLSALP